MGIISGMKLGKSNQYAPVRMTQQDLICFSKNKSWPLAIDLKGAFYSLLMKENREPLDQILLQLSEGYQMKVFVDGERSSEKYVTHMIRLVLKEKAAEKLEKLVRKLEVDPDLRRISKRMRLEYEKLLNICTPLPQYLPPIPNEQIFKCLFEADVEMVLGNDCKICVSKDTDLLFSTNMGATAIPIRVGNTFVYDVKYLKLFIVGV
jgi:hypothetical protein